MVYILLISTAFTQFYLLPQYPDYTSHKDNTFTAGEHSTRWTDFSTIFKLLSILLSLYAVTTMLKVSDLQHKLSQYYSSITYDFPMNSRYSENVTVSVLSVVRTIIKNQNHMKIAQQILQRSVGEQELGICELENQFSQD